MRDRTVHPPLLLVGCSGSCAAVSREIQPEARAYPDGIVAFPIRADGTLDVGMARVTGWEPTSYATYDEARGRLFVLTQTNGDKPSAVGAFAVGDDGELTFINQQSTEGVEACHLAVSPAGGHVASAHFSSANYSVHPVDARGALQPASHLLEVTGSGPHRRQNVPHPHMVQFAPDGDWAITADMGTDEVASHRLDLERGILEGNQVPAARVQPGGGARHFVLAGSRIFVCNELDSSVTVMRFDPATGHLAYRDHQTTLLDASRSGEAHCGAIRLSPDGRFLYVANRGRGTVAVFKVEGDALSPVGEASCPGEGARDMLVIDNAVYVAFAGGDRLSVFPRDAGTGEVGPLRQTLDLPAPMFVLAI